MDTFDFPYHTCATEYPESSTRVKFGRSYDFATKPDSPDQRVFTLKFALLKYFVDGSDVIDLTPNPKWNLAVLEAFYAAHRTWDTFIYPHPVYGNLNVKFNKPLKIPEGEIGGDGAVKDINLELIEQP